MGVEANSIRLFVVLMTLFFGLTITTAETAFFVVRVVDSDCDCKSTLGSTCTLAATPDDVADNVAVEEDDEDGGNIGSSLDFSVDLRSSLGPGFNGKVFTGVGIERRQDIRRRCRHGVCVSDIVSPSLDLKNGLWLSHR